MMRILNKIQNTWTDYPNNKDNALIVYFIGCPHNCKNCHNINLQDYNNIQDSIDISPKELYDKLIIESKKYDTNKLVLEGGDPLYYKNIYDVKKLLLLNNYFDVCIYTGYEISYVKENNIYCKYIKTGKYKEILKQDSIKVDEYIQFASSNQILYNGISYIQLSFQGRYYF